MNLKQIWCYLRTFGKHVEFSPTIDSDSVSYILDNGDCYCYKCKYYLFTNYDFHASLKKMRDDWKMWWEA